MPAPKPTFGGGRIGDVATSALVEAGAMSMVRAAWGKGGGGGGGKGGGRRNANYGVWSRRHLCVLGGERRERRATRLLGGRLGEHRKRLGAASSDAELASRLELGLDLEA